MIDRAVMDAFGTGGADLVEKAAKEWGLTIVRREKSTTAAKDFTAEFLAFKNSGAEILIFYGHQEATALLQRQMRQLGSPFKFLGSPSAASKDALNLAREAAEGIWAVVDVVPGRSEANRRFAEAYKNECNEEYDNLSIWTYDGLKILGAAIQKAGEDQAKIRDAILATHGYDGVQGTFSFTPNGDGLSEVSIVEIEKGQPKLLNGLQFGREIGAPAHGWTRSIRDGVLPRMSAGPLSAAPQVDHATLLIMLTGKASSPHGRAEPGYGRSSGCPCYGYSRTAGEGAWLRTRRNARRAAINPGDRCWNTRKSAFIRETFPHSSDVAGACRRGNRGDSKRGF